MRYTQNKKAALDESKRLGVRYKRLLRCITHVCKLNNESFQDKLDSLNTGMSTEKDPQLASQKIIDSIAKLEGREHSELISNNDYSIENIPEKYDGAKENIHFYKSVDARVLDWHLALSIKKIPPEFTPPTKRQIKKEFRSEFDLIEPLITKVSNDLYSLLSKKLNYFEDILAFSPQRRAKDWESLVDKIIRIKSKVTSLTEIQDLIGLRIVTIFEKDIPTIERIVERNFNVERTYKPSYLNSLSDNSSTHKIVKTTVKSGAEDNNSVNLLAEIQIMTLAQFTFAKASHSLLYKKKVTSKKATKNSLKRVSALLESVEIELTRNAGKYEDN
ncbi:hypothetical protein [Shewanella sp. 30m-9]